MHLSSPSNAFPPKVGAIILNRHMGQLSIGSPAPDFELNDLAGQSHRLSDALKRGPVVLAFYKSSCPTCQFTFPFIQKIYSKVVKSAPWTLWGISQDDEVETRGFAKQHGITFDLLLDDHPYAVSADYGLQFVPGIFLIQPDGKISVSEYGFTKASLNQIAGFEFFTLNDGLPATRPG
jgi:peroxiredoxin